MDVDNQPPIRVVNVEKRFGQRAVLQGLSLRVERGEVYGLLGPNGVGKTTLIYLLLGFLRPNRGTITVLGRPPGAVRGRVGYVPEQARYHEHFTAREYLEALGRFSGLGGETLAARCRYVLNLVSLEDDADRRIGRYSKGMLQRLGIAQALIAEPDVLLLDEPTSGLAPEGQFEVIDLLAKLRELGQTILLCSHQLDEVESLCDRVGVLTGGRIAAQARVADLASARVTIVVGRQAVPEAMARALSQRIGNGVQVNGREIGIASGDEDVQKALRLLVNANVPIAEVRPTLSGLSDLYLRAIHGQTVPEAFLPADDSNGGGEA